MTGFRINDPWFNEFVYDCIDQATPEQRSRLPYQLIKYVHTPGKRKHFAEHALLEKKLEMLARLGISWSIRLTPSDNMSIKEEIIETYDNFRNGKRRADIEKMIKEKKFIFCDRDVMAVIGVMAQNCHSQTYMLNRDYGLLAKSAVNASQLHTSDQIKPLQDDFKIIVRLLLSNLMNQTFIDGLVGYQTEQIIILLYLYAFHGTYVEEKTIVSYFNGICKARSLQVTLYLLLKSNQVIRLPGTKQYSIAPLGAQVVIEYTARVSRASLGT